MHNYLLHTGPTNRRGRPGISVRVTHESPLQSKDRGIPQKSLPTRRIRRHKNLKKKDTR